MGSVACAFRAPKVMLDMDFPFRRPKVACA
jgi:hypothetical protein